MYGKIRKIHFIGIGGIGMSGIAEVLINMGYEISGSDIKETNLTEKLKKLGANIKIGHSSENIIGSDAVVYSSAIRKDNPEIIYAKESNVTLIPRAEMLAELMRLKFGITVVGSHGKTTTTSMIASVLSHSELDPTIVVGGKVKSLDSNAHLGTGNFIVVEADESDGSFEMLSPVIIVLTNIDEEHLDHYKNMENLEKAFLKFLNKIPFYGLAVLCSDCPRTKLMAKKFNKRVITYGLDKDADLRADNIEVSGFKTSLDIYFKEQLFGKIKLNTLGKHNAQNALASIAVGMELGLSFEEIKDGLNKFKGIERRLQIKSDKNGILIIDDYGHHPKEIQTTLEAIKSGFSKYPTLIFQPHRYSRTNLLYNKFIEVLKDVENLYILDIYPAGEKPIDNISSRKLTEDIQKAGNKKVLYAESYEELLNKLKNKLVKGDIVLTSGAGNVWEVGEQLKSELQ